VLPDNPAVSRHFDYLVPDRLADSIHLGSLVRIDLSGRRLGGWVVADDVEPPAGVALRPVRGVTGFGPPADVLELADWAAWRWAGRPAHFLRTASPPGAVKGLPPPATGRRPSGGDPVAEEVLAAGGGVVRLPPAADLVPAVRAAARRGPALVVAPSAELAGTVAAALRAEGAVVALLPGGWARAAAGADVVVGARATAWAPVPGLAAVVVLDEHDEVHQEEAAPTWHARDVAVERARRAGAPWVLTSPCPSLAGLAAGPVVAPSRADERAGWPLVDVVDRRREDPLRGGLYSPALVELVRSARPGRRVVCVLNRTGRVRLLACTVDGELARCEVCGAAVAQDEAGELRCPRCGARRPPVCLVCGSSRFKAVRLGVTRAREDLERLDGRPVALITAAGGTEGNPEAPVVVGTEAVLHRVRGAAVVAFLDLDAELLAPRYRAAEEAMALVARAARLVGPRSGGGRLLLQTRLPDHEVVAAALHADPSRVAEAEASRRATLRFPPAAAVAAVSGAAAEAFVEPLRATLGLDVLGPLDGRWLVRAPDAATLCDALAATPRPAGRLRVAVDPVRL
jgi:primosomal protein N' (replication factor Y) (superfamily II helicase)